MDYVFIGLGIILGIWLALLAQQINRFIVKYFLIFVGSILVFGAIKLGVEKIFSMANFSGTNFDIVSIIAVLFLIPYVLFAGGGLGRDRVIKG